MHTNFIIAELKRNKNLFRDILTGLPEELYTWKPTPEKWCLLEIVCHLLDEEREDFRARVMHVLNNPNNPMPAIDPVGWVAERKYIEQNFDGVLQQFLVERDLSVNWLHELEDPNWEEIIEHPQLGKVQARMFFTNWLAHDYLHLRQIIRLKYDYLLQFTHENLAYAGDWV